MRFAQLSQFMLSTFSASFIAHLGGELYLQIMESRSNFILHMTISGKTTGKHLVNLMKNKQILVMLVICSF